MVGVCWWFCVGGRVVWIFLGLFLGGWRRILWLFYLGRVAAGTI
jgi:hypothetical protein